MESGLPVLFYADLNCPFCHVENERLIRAGLEDQVNWRGAEHMPKLPAPWDLSSAPDREMLEREVALVHQRAPDVEVSLPPQRPNSRRAIHLIAAAQELDMDAALELRTALFRALWNEGRDISDPAVTDDLCAKVGLTELAPSRHVRRAARVWTTEWNNFPWGRRIPILMTALGERLLGLASQEQIAAFIADPTQGGHGPDVCRGK